MKVNAIRETPFGKDLSNIYQMTAENYSFTQITGKITQDMKEPMDYVSVLYMTIDPVQIVPTSIGIYNRALNRTNISQQTSWW